MQNLQGPAEDPGIAPVAPMSNRRRAATRVLAGSLPEPLLTSAPRRWNGLTLELHHFHELDARVQGRDHVIAVQLAGITTVHRERNGRTRSRTLRPGDVSVTPAGPPVRWQQSAPSMKLLLRLASDCMCVVAGDECAIDPDRFELRTCLAMRDPDIERLARRLLAALEIEGSDGHLCAETLTCELALHLLRRHTTAAAVPTWRTAKLAPHKLRRALQYIEENLASELTLAAIAQAVALSPGHFAHAFRQATGLAPHRYVLEKRVESAKLLLRQSGLPIIEIAERVGCASHSHFSVLFHRLTGVTPTEFRRLA